MLFLVPCQVCGEGSGIIANDVYEQSSSRPTCTTVQQLIEQLQKWGTIKRAAMSMNVTQSQSSLHATLVRWTSGAGVRRYRPLVGGKA